MKKSYLLGAVGICIVFISSIASATSLELNSGSLFGNSTAVGSGRGISFHADSAFSIDSVGIFGDLFAESYDVVIYSSTDGHQANSILTSATADVGGIGHTWNDIAINFSFTLGDYYVLNWRPSDGGSGVNGGWANLSLYRDAGLPVSVGPTTLIDGLVGFSAGDFSNNLHPNLRINATTVVPIPAAAWLFGSGFLVLVSMAGRKNM